MCRWACFLHERLCWRAVRSLTVAERLNLRTHALPVLSYIIVRLCRMARIVFNPSTTPIVATPVSTP